MATTKVDKRPTRHVQKNDTSKNWDIASKNGFIPLKGELIIYNDLKNFKIGDGQNTPNRLEFQRTIPGEFLEIGDDGKLNVITSYDYEAGTFVEYVCTYDFDHGAYDYYFKPIYPIKELVSARIGENNDEGGYGVTYYELLDDGTVHIYVNNIDPNVYVEVTYTHDAGTKSLFDDLKIPDPTIETKIENGNLYIKYNNGDFLLVGKVVGKDGEQGKSGVYVGSGDMPEGYDIQIDPSGDPDEFYEEEWIDIADITTEEDLAQVIIDQDINGQPFEVKRIVAKVSLNAQLLNNGVWVSTAKSFYSGKYFGMNMATQTRKILVDIIGGEKFVEITMYQQGNTADTFWNPYGTPTGRTILNPKPSFNAFQIGTHSTVLVIPTGTRIQVWGVKS